MVYGHIKALCRREQANHVQRFKHIKDDEGNQLIPCTIDLQNWSWDNRMLAVAFDVVFVVIF